MSVFLFPASFADELQRMMNSFWWGSKKNEGRSIHWLSWDKLCVQKEFGGLGFRDFHNFNLAMLGKQGWNLISNPDALVCRFLKAKYYPRGDFLNAQLGHNPSYTWRSIWSSRVLLEQGVRWKIGTGHMVKVWDDPWLRDSENMRIETLPTSELSGLTVHDLMIPGYLEWDVELVSNLFCERDIEQITSIPLCYPPSRDCLIWHFAKNGIYSVRSGYRLAAELTGDTSQIVMRDWKRLWGLKVPPKVKNFLWRLGRNCLPTKDNLQRKEIHVPSVCALCNSAIENSWHLFVTCPFVVNCCREASLTQVVSQGISEVESFLDWFFLMISRLSESDLGKWCMVLWCVWRQRNEAVWNGSHLNASLSVRLALDFLFDWLKVKLWPAPLIRNNHNNGDCSLWHVPPPNSVKCNIDAASFVSDKMTGLGAILRDSHGIFITCRSRVIVGCFDSKESEAIALLDAVSWVCTLGFTKVIFKSDALSIINAINSPKPDSSEFGVIIKNCRNLLDLHQGFSVRFARRQANECAHAMARASRSFASPFIAFEPPGCIVDCLQSFCNNLAHYE